MKYAKINGTQIEWLSKDNALNYLDEKELNTDGFKEFVPAQYEQGKAYEWSYEETETQIIEHVKEIVPSPEDVLKMAKEIKIRENDELRDKALSGGVTYQNVLFDSDTDQKINLSEQYKRMSDTDTVVWHGMNNVDLLCTKSDLQAIGDLIYDLTAFVWGNNAYIKEQIENAKTIEEVENIEINYERG